jgi:NOL1/NOP2/fmu family ribosome biogenesis protein
MFRKENESINEWYAEINQKNQIRQLEILEEACKLVASNGKLIYSTCTFSKLENEDVISKFLQNHSEFKLSKPTDLSLKNSSEGINGIGRRVYPHKNIGEGQYFAVLEKENDGSVYIKQKNNMRKMSLREEKIFNKWKEENLINFNQEIKVFENTLLAIPNFEINTKEIYTLKYGTILGKIEKERFAPNHNFFTAFSECFKNKINLTLDDERVLKYLKGESLIIENSNNGYACIFVNSFALGGVKISNERANNLYPKHLRIINSNFNF